MDACTLEITNYNEQNYMCRTWHHLMVSNSIRYVCRKCWRALWNGCLLHTGCFTQKVFFLCMREFNTDNTIDILKSLFFESIPRQFHDIHLHFSLDTVATGRVLCAIMCCLYFSLTTNISRMWLHLSDKPNFISLDKMRTYD